MAHERIPPDPNRPGFNDDYRDRPQRLEEDLQIDPELAEGPASGGKIALVCALHRAGARRGVLWPEQFEHQGCLDQVAGPDGTDTAGLATALSGCA